MEFQPERALILNLFCCHVCTHIYVEMEFQPERALILITIFVIAMSIITCVEMEPQPERALIRLLWRSATILFFSVEMEPQPERALIRFHHYRKRKR